MPTLSLAFHQPLAPNRNVRLRPAFVTPPVLTTLVENFNVAPISTPAEDLKAILG